MRNLSMNFSIKTNINLKIASIIVITLLLMIPTSMIESLIHEREATQKEAIYEVSSKWGKGQTLIGPFISIPYYKYIKQKKENSTFETTTKVKDYIHFLPTDLKINGEISPERRHRGIYEIIVYNSNLTVSGSFDSLNFSDFDIPMEEIQFEKATLSMGISDLRGIEKQIILDWNGGHSLFNPGTVSDNVIKSGINTNVDLTEDEECKYEFSLNLELKGSQKLYFVPSGETSDITVGSSWNNPSFNGAFLPDTRKINENGFEANWNILHLNRNFPQKWTGSNNKINKSQFGVDLLLPVDSYQKSVRSIKYALLFIALTFIVFFFVEILQKTFIHPVQYILVGFALVVFYTLLLSISEHLTYNFTFIISAVSTILLIAGYVKSVLKSGQLALLIGGILTILYTFIFTLIQLQGFALLIGSIGIFIILALVMYFSRKIDWFDLKLDK